ncbi:MAG: SRPBCC family protein [Acidobacteriota bacterium]
MSQAQGQPFRSELWIDRPRSHVFPFFADAFNLELITPQWLRFEVLTPAPIPMKIGTRIAYRLRLHGFPVRWESIITAWDPPRRFVDEQRQGPYRFWRHLHTFEEHRGGTLVRDEIFYSVPGGKIVDRCFVRPELERIFRFRRAKLLSLLG